MTATHRRRVKRIAADLLWRLGLLGAVARFRLRRRAVVLTYHRVLPADQLERSWSSPGMTVSTPTFEGHLKALRSVFTPLSLEQFVDHVETGRPFDGPACLVTFDDGWWDTLDQAVPLLRKYEIPAVVFVPVDCLGSPDGFWQERLGRCLHHAWTLGQGRPDRLGPAATALLDEYGLSQVLALRAEHVRDDIRAIVATVKSRGGDLARELVRRLQDVLDVGPATDPSDRLLDRAGLRRLEQSGVAIGGHGATHRILTELTPAQASEEARRSFAELRTLLTGPVLAYSYPNGNSNPEVEAVTQAAGYAIGFTTKSGWVTAAADRMALPRINIHEGSAGSPATFLARASGLF